MRDKLYKKIKDKINYLTYKEIDQLFIGKSLVDFCLLYLKDNNVDYEKKRNLIILLIDREKEVSIINYIKEKITKDILTEYDITIKDFTEVKEKLYLKKEIKELTNKNLLNHYFNDDYKYFLFNHIEKELLSISKKRENFHSLLKNTNIFKEFNYEQKKTLLFLYINKVFDKNSYLNSLFKNSLWKLLNTILKEEDCLKNEVNKMLVDLLKKDNDSKNNYANIEFVKNFFKIYNFKTIELKKESLEMLLTLVDSGYFEFQEILIDLYNENQLYLFRDLLKEKKLNIAGNKQNIQIREIDVFNELKIAEPYELNDVIFYYKAITRFKVNEANYMLSDEDYSLLKIHSKMYEIRMDEIMDEIYNFVSAEGSAGLSENGELSENFYDLLELRYMT